MRSRVLRILAMYSEGNYSVGTGFFVDDSGTIVTAAHVGGPMTSDARTAATAFFDSCVF